MMRGIEDECKNESSLRIIKEPEEITEEDHGESLNGVQDDDRSEDFDEKDLVIMDHSSNVKHHEQAESVAQSSKEL